MNFIKTLKKVLSDACVYFTFAEFVILAVAAAYRELSPEAGGGAAMFLSLSSAALILLACGIASALNLVFKLELSMPLRVLIHFMGALVAFGIVFVVIPGVYTDFTAMFVRLGIFTALYAVIAFVALIVRSVRMTRHTEELEYESQFGEFFAGKNRTGKR